MAKSVGFIIIKVNNFLILALVRESVTVSSIVINIVCAGAFPDGSSFSQNNQALSSPFNFSYITTIGVSCQISLQSLTDTILGTLTPIVPANPTTFTMTTSGTLSGSSAQTYTDSANTSYTVTPSVSTAFTVQLSLNPLSQVTATRYTIAGTNCNRSGQASTTAAAFSSVILNENTNSLTMSLSNLNANATRPNWCLIVPSGSLDYTNLSTFLGTTLTSVCGATAFNNSPYNNNSGSIDCTTYFGRAYASFYFLFNGSFSGLSTINCTTGASLVNATTLSGSSLCPDTPTPTAFRTSSPTSSFTKSWSSLRSSPSIMVIANNCRVINRPSFCSFSVFQIPSY